MHRTDQQLKGLKIQFDINFECLRLPYIVFN